MNGHIGALPPELSFAAAVLAGAALLLVVVLVIVVVVLFKRPSNQYKPKSILTGNEREFFGRLIAAVPELHVLPQVAMGAILEPNVKGNSSKYMSIRGTFSQKIVDFVVCDKRMNIVALVELDDRTHDPKRDTARDKMTKCAGYVTLRYESRAKPDVSNIRKDLIALLK